MMNYTCNPCFRYGGQMEIKGVGTLSLMPDKAIVSLGVITEDKSLEKAQKENIERTNAVIRNLTNLGVEMKDISTSNYSIQAQYDYVDGKKIFRGYKVTNILDVTVRNISDLGKIIDSSVKAGANSVGSIRFTVSDKQKYYEKALNLAIKNAISKAMSIGKTLNVSVNKIPIIIKEELNDSQIQNTALIKSYSASTEILPSNVSINAVVKCIFRY
ncbi:SIMPL domain-containing protein [Clostridium oceanicum]